jgi:hypothetical protein
MSGLTGLLIFLYGSVKKSRISEAILRSEWVRARDRKF